MGETVEKIYCCDRDNNDNALAAALDGRLNAISILVVLQVAGQVGFSAERVINAVNLGDCNVIQALQNCCCQTQRQIADFRAGQDNTQRIIDTLNNHWKDEQALKIQDLKFELSQERQNNLLLSRLGGNGCGCNNSCGCGCGQ